MFLCEVVSSLFRVVTSCHDQAGAGTVGLLEARQFLLSLSYGVPRLCSQCEEFKWFIFLDCTMCLCFQGKSAVLQPSTKQKMEQALGIKKGHCMTET